MNKDLTQGNPRKVLWAFCLPMFGSIVFQQLYNIADSLVAGKFIGERALAAVLTDDAGKPVSLPLLYQEMPCHRI